MSGRKRILIDESAFFDRLRRSAGLGDIRRNAPVFFAAVSQRVQQELDLVFAEIDQRQRAAEQAAAGLSDGARAIEEQINERLREQSQQAESEWAEQQSPQDEPAAIDHESVWRAELAQSRQQARAEVDELAGQMRALHDDRERLTGAAEQWIGDSYTIRDLVKDSLPHERVAPGQLRKLEGKLATAAADLEAGLAGPALSIAQGIYHDLSDLRILVEVHERDRRLAQTTAYRGLVVVLELIEANAERAVEDQHGRRLPGVTLDVNHWSWGALAELRTEVEQAAAAVRDEQRPMPTDQLRTVASAEVPELERRLSDIVRQAGLRQLASQIRVNLAEVVAHSLDSHAGYEFIEGTYAGGDEREAFYARLGHQNGSEIVVDIAPASANDVGYVVEVHSFDREIGAEAEQRDRADAVVRALNAQGIPARSPEVTTEQPDPAVRDFAAIRRAAPEAAAGESA